MDAQADPFLDASLDHRDLARHNNAAHIDIYVCDVWERSETYWSPAAIHEALIAAFWRGEFEQDGRSVVFTLGTPPGASVGDDGGVCHIDEDGERLHEVMVQDRECVSWNRSEVVAALLRWDRNFIPPRYSTQEAVFSALSAWPLDHWSSFSRYMFWDQLCITVADLADWLSRTGQSIPRFLVREHPIEGALDRERTDTSIEADPAAVRAPGKIGSQLPLSFSRIRSWISVTSGVRFSL